MERNDVTTRTTVQSLRWLTDSVFVLRFDRGTLDFAPGQYVTVGPADSIDMREYSIYSPPAVSYIEILVKLVEGGVVSHALAILNPGDEIRADGPFGFFTIDDDWRDVSYRFIATGTGISPFHDIVMSYPDIDYSLLHGTRTYDERFELETYDPSRVIRCISRESADAADDRREEIFAGRVTDYLRQNPVEQDSRYYLCGNCDMIYEVFDILQEAGVPHSQIFAEVYF